MKLYHYTTIDVLALILKNRTLRFNCLKNVDDQEEGETFDFGSFKNYLFVSCWTKDKHENIALWNMYSKNMEGIRLGIDIKNIKFKAKEREQIPLYHLVENVVPSNKNSAFILWLDRNKKGEMDPKISVKYNLKKKYLFKLKKTDNWYQYNFIDLASKKRKEWAFQKEIRYVLFGASVNNSNEQYSHQHIINSIVAKEEYNCEYVDLVLDEYFFNEIEILTGPRMEESGKVICKTLLDHYIGEGKYSFKESELKIISKKNV